jgi:hypothetical protein
MGGHNEEPFAFGKLALQPEYYLPHLREPQVSGGDAMIAAYDPDANADDDGVPQPHRLPHTGCTLSDLSRMAAKTS